MSSNKCKINSVIFNIILICNLFLSVYSVTEANNLIVNDRFWRDTNGNFIYSQGGGIFKFGNTYYWYGVHYNGAETYALKPEKKKF